MVWSLEEMGEALWNEFAPMIGVLFVMIAVVIGVGKIWEKSWNLAIKCIMVLVVFIVEMACICVMPLDIGKRARELFGNII